MAGNQSGNDAVNKDTGTAPGTAAVSDSHGTGTGQMHTVWLLGAVLMFPIACLLLVLLLDRLESGLDEAVMKAVRRPTPSPVTAVPTRAVTSEPRSIRSQPAPAIPTAATKALPKVEPVELPAVS